MGRGEKTYEYFQAACETAEQAHGILYKYVIWLSFGTRCFCYYYVRLVATALFISK